MSDGYSYHVSIDPNPDRDVDGKKYRTATCTDPADAMALWSQAVTDGAEYVVIEALKDRPPKEPARSDR
jgi:hypothetical protein